MHVLLRDPLRGGDLLITPLKFHTFIIKTRCFDTKHMKNSEVCLANRRPVVDPGVEREPVLKSMQDRIAYLKV